MADYQVKCTKKDGADPDRRIDALGGTFATAPIDHVIYWIQAGHSFWVEVGGRRVSIRIERHPQTGREYLTTEADKFPPNNLLKLPDCPK